MAGMWKRFRPGFYGLLLTLAALASAFAGPQADAPALKRLRDQLAATRSLGDADVVAVIGERALAETAARLSGLEIKLSNGSLLRVTSVALELRNAAAVVRLGVEARPPALTAALGFQVAGRLGGGEVNGSRLRLPFELTEVALGGGPAPPLLRTFFREWLSPERWNAALPPLEIPLQLSEVIELPAARFDVEGQMPMEITTPAYRVQADFTLAAMLILNGRAAVALSLSPRQPGPQSHAAESLPSPDAAALEAEIEQLARPLDAGGSDISVRIRRGALDTLLRRIAAAESTDLTMRLKPSRIRSEEVDGIFRTLNYTDVESGDGRADVQALSAERVARGRVDLRLNVRGEMQLRVRGREYAIPYSLSPRGTFAIMDEVVPLELTTEGGRVTLRAAPGSRVPISVRVGIEIAGHSISIPRTVEAPADRWLSGVALPTFFDREIQLPRRIEADAGGQMQTVASAAARYTFSKLVATADDDVLEVRAEVSVAR
jgi:hypothetical protein